MVIQVRKAKKIVSEFFSPKTELNKELRLYELLIKEKYNTESRAEKFIDTVNEAHNRIDQKQLQERSIILLKRLMNHSIWMISYLHLFLIIVY
jgi:hypothetical protein